MEAKRTFEEAFAILTRQPVSDGYRITPYDPEFDRQMTMERRVMKERRNVLKELAK